jgi:hypothetical protein
MITILIYYQGIGLFFYSAWLIAFKLCCPFITLNEQANATTHGNSSQNSSSDGVILDINQLRARQVEKPPSYVYATLYANQPPTYNEATQANREN